MINYQSATENQLRVTNNQEQSIQHKQIQFSSSLQGQNTENQEKVEDDIVNQEQRNDYNQEVIPTVEDAYSDRQYLQATSEEIAHLKKRRRAKNNKTELCLLKFCLFLFVFIVLIGVVAFFVFYEEKKVRDAQQSKNINMFALDGQISTVFIVKNQQDKAFQSLSSYLDSIYDYSKNNKGKLKFSDILIGYDYNMSQNSRNKVQESKNKLNKLIESPVQIKWVYNNKLNIQFVDKLIKEVQSEYFFFSTTEYVYQSQNQQNKKNSIRFVELSLSILTTFPQTAQLILNQNQGAYYPNNNIEVSFSFSPALHRTKDFHYLNKGYQDVVGGESAMEQSQDKISEYYLGRNLYAMKVDKNFGIIRIDKPKQIKIQQSTNPKFPQTPQLPSQSQLKSVQGKYGVPKNIFENIKQQEIKNLHFKQIQTEIAALQKKELNTQNYFINRLHNARHFYTFSEYLLHNRAFNILTVNCNQNCKQRFQVEYSASNHINKMKMKTKHISHLSELRSDQNKAIPTVPQYDWISFEDLELFFSSALQTQFLIQNYTNYGISVITDISSIHSDVLLNILRHMENKDFYYDQAKSLCMARIINKKVMIFIKGQLHNRQAQLSKSGKKNPKKNLVSIQTVFKMKENIPFIREWLIYHIEIGIDKFYLYDNSNSSYSSADFRATSDTNRFGMSLQCINYTTDQVQIQWQNLWAQFYQHIIYIIWQPKDSNNKVYYGQVEAQHDYIKNYKDVVKYTLFIDIDEMLFSPEDKNLEQFLQRYENNRISSIKFLQRHFVNRYCQPNRRMSQIYHFFQSQNSKLYNMKIIAETNSFLPFQTISQGKATRGRQIVVPESQFRINHYSLQRNQFITMREKGILLGSTFQADNSILRYQSVLDARCRGLCSDIFAIKCPQDKVFANCLDVKEKYPWQMKEKAPVQNQKPIQPNQPTQPNQPRPTPRQPEKNPSPNPQPPRRPPPTPYSPSKFVSGYLAQIQGALKQPRQFFQLSILNYTKQLPICAIIVPSKNYTSDVLIKSVRAQNYSNYQIIEAPQQKQINSTNNSTEQTSENYYYFINRIIKECKLNPLVIFVRSPLLSSAFDHLNKKHQKYVAYVSYSKSQKSVQIHSFFFRIYELLDKNDFNGRNKPLLKQNVIEVQALGFLQISRQFVIEVQRDKIIKPEDDAYFIIRRDSTNKFQRPEYTAIYRLSQDFPGNVIAYNQGTIAKSRIIPGSRLTIDHMYRAVERQQEWYLPENHTIEEIQFKQLDSIYNISKYTDISRQVRFCVTILSHNNIQNDRYVKILKSILQQKYENYHIVFIDDNSTDSNMNSTIQYLNSVKFPKNRVKYVQNLERRFATYNIINAGFNFCDEKDVQMLMDGDDQFIGKYAFQVMNSAYQSEQKENKQVWVAYSNYKSNFFTFGRSKGMNSDFEHLVGNRRSYISIFGPIRTWRVQVIYNIPILHHKLQNGQWLDTVYDDAISHPLFQISTVKRVRYMPELLSEYNMRYGDNDDSTSQKIKHRSDAYRYIISLTPLAALTTLQGSVKDLEVMKELTADKDVKYTTIDV